MFAFAAAAILSQLAPIDKVEVATVHVRPSTLLKRMTPPGQPGLIPNGVSASFDDERSVIILRGEKEQDLKDVKSAIALFDVKLVKVDAKVDLISPLDKFATHANVELTNNSPWSMKEPSLGIEFSMLPRINADGTITVYLEVTESEPASYHRGGYHQSLVFRIKNKEQTEIGVDSHGALLVGHGEGAKVPIQTIRRTRSRPRLPSASLCESSSSG